LENLATKAKNKGKYETAKLILNCLWILIFESK